MFATISRSGRILRSVFFAGGRSSFDWSYAWSRDQQRLEKIDGMIHHIVGNRTTSGSHKGSIVRSVVAPDDRSNDQSWNSATDSVVMSVSNRMVVPPTGRKVARPVLNMTIELVATDFPLAITHDLCD